MLIFVIMLIRLVKIVFFGIENGSPFSFVPEVLFIFPHELMVAFFFHIFPSGEQFNQFLFILGFFGVNIFERFFYGFDHGIVFLLVVLCCLFGQLIVLP